MYTNMLITPKVRYKYKVTITKIIIIHIKGRFIILQTKVKVTNSRPRLYTPAEVFASLSGRKDKIMRPCIFCDGDHYNDQCKRYATLVSRKRKLKKNDVLCLKPGHVLKSCLHLHK